jgi:hypothetical protein
MKSVYLAPSPEYQSPLTDTDSDAPELSFRDDDDDGGAQAHSFSMAILRLPCQLTT